MSRYVDWEFAKTTGRTLVSPGPQVTPAQAAVEVSAIREAAAKAREPVAETARLHTPGDAPQASVVDRATWIAVNADSMSALLDPAFEQMMASRSTPLTGPMATVGGKVTGAEAGGLLAFMASKVLGQYDLAPDGTPTLLLVAPNIVQVQRDLAVDARDFRPGSACTRRPTGSSSPPSRGYATHDHPSTRPRRLDDPRRRPARRPRPAAPREAARGGQRRQRRDTDLVTTPEQRERLAAVTAVMSLLEGHADVVMDEVGPSVIPTVAEIRAKFSERRKGAGALDRLLRRLLGLEAKMRQYHDGAAFVRGVTDVVGVDGFNAVWTSAQTLPLAAEITDPQAWVRRVHG